MGYIEPLEFASLGLLAVAFASMSSADLGMRKLAYDTLMMFLDVLEVIVILCLTLSVCIACFDCLLMFSSESLGVIIYLVNGTFSNLNCTQYEKGFLIATAS